MLDLVAIFLHQHRCYRGRAADARPLVAPAAAQEDEAPPLGSELRTAAVRGEELRAASARGDPEMWSTLLEERVPPRHGRGSAVLQVSRRPGRRKWWSGGEDRRGGRRRDEQVREERGKGSHVFHRLDRTVRATFWG